MKYIFDSDILSYFYNSGATEHQVIKERFSLLSGNDITQISEITLFELEYSFYNSPPDKKKEIREIINDVKNDFEVILLKSSYAPLYGEIKALLKKSKQVSTKKMRQYNIDLLVASTAIGESSILVSRDEVYPDLASIFPQLQYQNWLN